MKFIPTLSNAIVAIIAVTGLLLVMSMIDDSRDESIRQEQIEFDAIKQARAESAERKREFNRAAFEAQRMTGFQAAMK